MQSLRARKWRRTGDVQTDNRRQWQRLGGRIIGGVAYCCFLLPPLSCLPAIDEMGEMGWPSLAPSPPSPPTSRSPSISPTSGQLEPAPRIVSPLGRLSPPHLLCQSPNGCCVMIPYPRSRVCLCSCPSRQATNPYIDNLHSHLIRSVGRQVMIGFNISNGAFSRGLPHYLHVWSSPRQMLRSIRGDSHEGRQANSIARSPPAPTIQQMHQ